METIRQRLTRQTRTVFVAVLASIALGMALAVTGERFEQIAIFLIMGCMFGAVVYANVAIKCPKCGHSLVLMLNFGTAVPSLQCKSDRENFCPHCGVSFDEKV